MTERPVAALLSGGLDSSLIAALVQRELVALGKPALETFTVGFENSPDVLHARQVATHIGSKHTEIIVTPDQFFEVIPQVIHDIESYDITSVRASVGNWFVSREIRRQSDAKVVFNGDGADELFGSYLYFFRSPDDESYEAEVSRLLTDIHKYDVLRSDRCISSHGLEPRTPFLDKQFVSLVRSVPTELLRPRKGVKCEKWILRKAFEPFGLLPDSVLWRQKEAFSDGVSGTAKSWYQEIQERIPESGPKQTFWYLTPQTEEAYYYRSIFHQHYGMEGEKVLSYFWMPKWSGETKDPSARTLSLY
jgi:asparagine synthase (glutamine-hydrolysing)